VIVCAATLDKCRAKFKRDLLNHVGPLCQFALAYTGCTLGRATGTICRNEECQATEYETRKFSRCSVCMTACYCSAACQIADWKAAGGHKAECGRLARLREISKSVTPAEADTVSIRFFPSLPCFSPDEALYARASEVGLCGNPKCRNPVNPALGGVVSSRMDKCAVCDTPHPYLLQFCSLRCKRQVAYSAGELLYHM
jgi:hypothetical protein